MSAPAPSRSLSGVTFALASWALFSLQDAIVKALVVGLSVPEVLFGRSLVILAASIFIVRRADYRAMAEPRHAAAIAMRSALILAAWIAYYSASRELQLADLVTYYFAAPLFVVALSVPMLGERVSLARWLAVFVGFGGVVIAADPRGGAPTGPVALAVLAAAAWAITTVLARNLSRGVSTAAMMLASAAVFALACGAGLPWYGTPLSVGEIEAIAALGVVGTVAQYLWFEGVRRAQASLLAPLEYSLLACAIFWGYAFFGDLPGLRTLAGASVILASGLAMMAAEIRRARMAPRAV